MHIFAARINRGDFRGERGRMQIKQHIICLHKLRVISTLGHISVRCVTPSTILFASLLYECVFACLSAAHVLLITVPMTIAIWHRSIDIVQTMHCTFFCRFHCMTNKRRTLHFPVSCCVLTAPIITPPAAEKKTTLHREKDDENRLQMVIRLLFFLGGKAWTKKLNNF